MANPAPGYAVSTAYGVKGGWSCGWHTGVDIACPSGTRLVAAIGGTIRHRNHGSSLGNHQFAISPNSDQPFGEGEVFYAHTRTRLADGTEVNVGDFVAECGVEGYTSGPHLHFEYHPTDKNAWGCDVCANPQVVLDHQVSTNGSAEQKQKRGKKMFFVRGDDTSEIYLVGGVGMVHIGDPNDLSQIQLALTDPYYVAIVTSYTLNEMMRVLD